MTEEGDGLGAPERVRPLEALFYKGRMPSLRIGRRPAISALGHGARRGRASMGTTLRRKGPLIRSNGVPKYRAPRAGGSGAHRASPFSPRTRGARARSSSRIETRLLPQATGCHPSRSDWRGVLLARPSVTRPPSSPKGPSRPGAHRARPPRRPRRKRGRPELLPLPYRARAARCRRIPRVRLGPPRRPPILPPRPPPMPRSVDASDRRPGASGRERWLAHRRGRPPRGGSWARGAVRHRAPA